MYTPKQIAKAIVGAVVAGLVTTYGVLADGGVSTQDWVAIALSVIGTGGGVFAVPNSKPFNDPTPPSSV